MSFDLGSLKVAVQNSGRVVRIVVVQVQGSVPREVGTAMLVWQDGQSGTIGGGRLEYEAVRQARACLTGGDWLRTFPLGPALGQCCGGSVTLLAESYDAKKLSGLVGKIYLRQVQGSAEVPLIIQSEHRSARNAGESVSFTFSNGWLLERISDTKQQLWVYGAGHVGRAIVNVLAPLPDCEIYWVDTTSGRFPNNVPESVEELVSNNPADAVSYSSKLADHLIVTYSHAFDLEICHRLLGHGFTSAGLIGSLTKWTRFRTRLQKLGHSDAQISRISCPIGQPELGKHPQAIAVGVAAGLLSRMGNEITLADRVG